MAYSGSFRCPDCQAPVFQGATICPYCSSTAPGRARRRARSWTPLVLVGVLVVIVWYSDVAFGTHYFQTLHGLLPRNGVY
jgi:RNA polymerase subunit RPABC4/transcription elongation factor Spt4